MTLPVNGAFIYSPEYRTISYGYDHPLRPTRLYLNHFLLETYGLLSGPGIRQMLPVEATREELLRVHSQAYLEALDLANSGETFPGALTWGLGFGDNPIFTGVREWAYLVCGGSLLSLREVASGRSDVAFHTGGGFHHAHHAKASGFCYLNDIAVAIKEQEREGRRVLYLDIDAHHGDGVQEAFYQSDRVITVSIHETPEHLFPGSGYVHELGEGEGLGYSVNVPLEPGSSDRTFVEAFEAVVPSVFASFTPELVVLQLGVDTMARDPLAHLNLTTSSLIHVLKRIRDLYSGPIMATGGGGYEMDTVARSWTLAWCLLSGQELPDVLPEAYLKERAKYGATGVGQQTLRDPEPVDIPDQTEPLRHLDHILKFLKERGVI